jgi:hypothetical protein
MGEGKVYCKDCKYYRSGGGGYWEYCVHPDNFRVDDTYREQVKSAKNSPRYLNSENNCKWFKEAQRFLGRTTRLLGKLL